MSKKKTLQINNVSITVDLTKLVVPEKKSRISIFFATLSVCVLLSNFAFMVCWGTGALQYFEHQRWVYTNICSLFAVIAYYLLLSDFADLQPSTNEQLQSIVTIKQSSQIVSDFIASHFPRGCMPTNYGHKIIKQMYDATIRDSERNASLAAIYGPSSSSG